MHSEANLQKDNAAIIVGAGLAGSEAALQLADMGFPVILYDMKPEKRSAAHHSTDFAEIVCSNSFGSQQEGSASGLLKAEMAQLGCRLLEIAQSVAVPAGQALAVDRDAFSAKVTEVVKAHPNIDFRGEDVQAIPEGAAVLIATGPLTSPGLAASISKLLERDQLYFFDAASPIIQRDSINMDIAFIQDRYALEKQAEADKAAAAENAELAEETGGSCGGESQDTTPSGAYINCPLEKDHYFALVDKLLTAEKTELKDFEKESASYFESCMPVEVIASRGVNTLRFGPMKPVGIEDPRTGRRPYAVVQLRQDNAEGTLFNMVGFQTNLKWGVQGEMIRMIPGLENAEVVRYGVMHRNTFIHSPEVLQPTLQLKKHPRVFFAGQLTGTEGYTESIATGLFAARNMARLLRGESTRTLPPETMLGALLGYITRPEAIGKSFQPINSNWGILPAPAEDANLPRKDKKARNRYYAARAHAALQRWLTDQPAPAQPV